MGYNPENPCPVCSSSYSDNTDGWIWKCRNCNNLFNNQTGIWAYNHPSKTKDQVSVDNLPIKSISEGDSSSVTEEIIERVLDKLIKEVKDVCIDTLESYLTISEDKLRVIVKNYLNSKIFVERSKSFVELEKKYFKLKHFITNGHEYGYIHFDPIDPDDPAFGMFEKLFGEKEIKEILRK